MAPGVKGEAKWSLGVTLTLLATYATNAAYDKYAVYYKYDMPETFNANKPIQAQN